MQKRAFKYYDFLVAAFVTILLCANVIGAGKVATIYGFTFGAGIVFFPLSYIFGDILTEVYGYARARRVVWFGFAGLIFASFMSYFILALPAADGWHFQKEYETVLGTTPRIAIASLIAFCCGEFSNSFILAKMKIVTKGRYLWSRTIGSTILGEGIDSLIFYPLAFWGIWSPDLVLTVMITNYSIKVLVEIFMTPVTYKIVNFLKRKENEDYYDTATDFTPFSVEV